MLVLEGLHDNMKLSKGSHIIVTGVCKGSGALYLSVLNDTSLLLSKQIGYAAHGTFMGGIDSLDIFTPSTYMLTINSENRIIERTTIFNIKYENSIFSDDVIKPIKICGAYVEIDHNSNKFMNIVICLDDVKGTLHNLTTEGFRIHKAKYDDFNIVECRYYNGELRLCTNVEYYYINILEDLFVDYLPNNGLIKLADDMECTLPSFSYLRVKHKKNISPFLNRALFMKRICTSTFKFEMYSSCNNIFIYKEIFNSLKAGDVIIMKFYIETKKNNCNTICIGFTGDIELKLNGKAILKAQSDDVFDYDKVQLKLNSEKNTHEIVIENTLNDIKSCRLYGISVRFKNKSKKNNVFPLIKINP